MSQLLLHLVAIVFSLVACAMAAFAWRQNRREELASAGVTDKRLSSVWRGVIRVPSRAFVPSGDDRAQMVARLAHAGRNGEKELYLYVEERTMSLFMGSAFGIAALFLMATPFNFLFFAICFLLGYVLPGVLVDGQAEERRDQIQIALPGAIDLMTTCVDSGLSIEQAIARVAKEYARTSPALADEFRMTSAECDAGMPLPDALGRMARRVEIDDMSGLCSVIAQSHELGAPIVDTLIDYSSTARKLRMAKLEEMAGKLVTKLIFPLAIFLLPAALVSILGPAALQLMEVLKTNQM